MSLILVGTQWTSSRSAGNVPTPNDLDHEGVFEFATYDPITGAVTGKYHDLDPSNDVPFEGSVTFNGGTSYFFVLRRAVPPNPVTRLYEGELVANLARIALVAGTFTNFSLKDRVLVRISRDEAEELNAQEEGVWVATKP